MRSRNIKKNFYLNNNEDVILRLKCRKAHLSQSEFIRKVIMGYEIKEKPDDEFYEAIKILRGISINLNQIAKKANSIQLIDEPFYKKTVTELNKFILQIKEKYLVDSKN